MRDNLHATDGRCPKCGGKVFRAVAGETTKDQVDDYKLRKTMATGPISWDPRWTPNGDYCYSCHWFDEK